MTFQNQLASIPARPARSISSEQEREKHLSPSPISRRYSSHFPPRSLSSPPGPRLSCKPNSVLGFNLPAVAGFWSWDAERAKMVFRRRPRDDFELDERLGLSSAKSPAKPEITTKSPSIAFAERELLHESLWDSTGAPRFNASLAREYQPAQSSPPSSPPPLRFNTNFQFSDWILPGGIDTSVPCDEDFADWPDLSNISDFFDQDPNTSTTSTDSDLPSPPTPVHGVGLGFGLGISNVYLKPKSFCHDGVVSETFLDEALLTFRTMESPAVNGASELIVIQASGRRDESRAGGRRAPDHEEDANAKSMTADLAAVAASSFEKGLGHVSDEIEDRDSTPKPVPVHVSTSAGGTHAVHVRSNIAPVENDEGSQPTQTSQVFSDRSRQLPSRQDSNYSNLVSPSVHCKNRLRGALHKSNYVNAINSTSRYTSNGTSKPKPKDSGNEASPQHTVLSTSTPTSEIRIRRVTSLQRARPQAGVRRDVTTSTVSSSFKSKKPLSSSIRSSSTLQRSTSGVGTSSLRGAGVVQGQQASAYAARKSASSVERFETPTQKQNRVEKDRRRGGGGRIRGSTDVPVRSKLERRTSWR